MKYFIPNPCDEKNRDREDFELACVMDHVSPTIMKYVNDLKRYSTYSKSIEIAKNVPTIIKIFWRVSEELTNKLIIFTIFAVAIYEVSIINFILLFFAVFLTLLQIPSSSQNYFPVKYFVYPIITIHLGILSTLKYLFQLKIVSEDTFGSMNCNVSSTNGCFSQIKLEC